MRVGAARPFVRLDPGGRAAFARFPPTRSRTARRIRRHTMTSQARPPELDELGEPTESAGSVGPVGPVGPPARRWLETAAVESPVFDLRPDYTALIIIAERLPPGPSHG